MKKKYSFNLKIVWQNVEFQEDLTMSFLLNLVFPNQDMGDLHVVTRQYHNIIYLLENHNNIRWFKCKATAELKHDVMQRLDRRWAEQSYGETFLEIARV